MDFIHSIILGVVQGLTEFLPISSSGHLVLAHDLLHFDFVDNLTFDVALHLGTLLALLVFFWRDIARYIVAFFRSLANWNLKNDVSQRLAWYIIVGSIPAGIGGFLLESKADEALRSPWLVAGLLIGVGVLFFIVEKYSTKLKTIEQAGWSVPIVVGLAQVVALLPGVSRSGATILAGLTRGLRRSDAARFSFLLSVPVILGAGLKKLYDAYGAHLGSHEWLVTLVGVLVAAAVGYAAIRFLLRFVQNHSLNAFGYYRIVLGLAVLVYLIIRG